MAFRTQKISQMTPKGANLEATDLIEVSTIESGSYVTRSITGQEIIDAAVGNVDWGDIGGTLSAQTDLQNALDAKVPTSRTLTINGVTQDLSANRTFTISTGITIGSTAIASGSVGRILFEGAGNVVQESSSLFWDATNNRLGIGTSTPSNTFQVKSPSGYPIAFFSQNDLVNQGGIAIYQTQISSTAGNPLYLTATGTLFFESSGAEAGRFTSTTRNLLINTTTDAGFRLDVNGTARVQGTTSITGSTSVLNVGDWTFRGASVYVRAASGGAENRGFFIGYGASTDGNAGSFTYNPTGNFLNIRSPYNNGTIALSFEGNTNSTQFHNTSGVVHSKIVSSTGNWLINTTTDAGFRLDVNGTARVNGVLTALQISAASRIDIFSDGANGVIAMQTLTNTLNLRKFVKIVGDNGGYGNNDASAAFQIDGTNRGFLPPRLTTTQKNAIASPAAGLVVYDTTLNKLCVYTTAWETVTSL